MKNPITPIKAFTHLEKMAKQYRSKKASSRPLNHEIAFKDTLIGREIISWQENLKQKLFGSI